MFRWKKSFWDSWSHLYSAREGFWFISDTELWLNIIPDPRQCWDHRTPHLCSSPSHSSNSESHLSECPGGRNKIFSSKQNSNLAMFTNLEYFVDPSRTVFLFLFHRRSWLGRTVAGRLTLLAHNDLVNVVNEENQELVGVLMTKMLPISFNDWPFNSM